MDISETRHAINGLDLAVWERPGAEPAILFAHATGFHGRVWDQVIARVPGRRAIAPDFRGHGLSSKPHGPYHWRSFGEDLAALAEALDLRDAVGVGHSMGGYSLVLASVRHPPAFSRLLLLDPVILPEQDYQGPGEPLASVLKRRNRWNSPSELVDRFSSKLPFQIWDPAVLRDYSEYALDGSELACRPAVEAEIYANSTETSANIYAEVAQVEAPVLVVRSSWPYAYGQFHGSPTAPDLAGRFRHGVDRKLDQITHFIPMEAPALTAKMIEEL